METYLKNEFITIHYSTEQKIIQLTWLGFIDSTALRQGLNIALNLAKQNKLNLWIMDQRLRRVLRSEDATWIINDWFPRFYKINPKSKIAILLPEDTFGEYNTRKNVKEIESRHQQMMPYKYFSTIKQALYWLTPVVIA
ncbi:hypothetical protein [uncultured Microscilla sp.]|uniref:hypothetical protein n=1 Tax=uncultured Microscilla sp. TaxID=432653 RepID=UPI002605F447|nr:hypothetical protein [uncultured Microscilla sp.]